MGPKKAKKKKAKDANFMTDEELQDLEEAKKRAEQERLEKERLQKEMEEELRRAKLEKKKRDKYLMQCEEFRNQLLKEHCSQFRTLMEEHRGHLIEKRNEKEWKVYVSCNHLPFANDPPALNTFLYTWSLIEDQLNMDNVLPESEIILETIQPVQCYLENPLDMKETTINNLKEAKLNYYNQILKNVDKVTFDAIMDVSKYHTQISPSQIEIYKKSVNLMIWMWGWAHQGRSEKEPKNIRPERKIPIMSVILPAILEVKRYHLRIFHTSYDPYSFQCESYNPPEVVSMPDLFEETINIRKKEISALKQHFMNDYDEDIMPWWFLMDKEIMEDIAKRELLKKLKVKKKKAHISTTSSMTNINTSVSETTAISPQTPEGGVTSEIQNSESNMIVEDDALLDEYEKEDIAYRTSKPESTQIIYSRSMSDLMEKRKHECNGPEYYPEVDPIEFLEQPNISLSEGSMEKYRDLLKTEKHTTFKAFLYLGDDGMSDGVILRDINDCLNRNDPSEERLSFADKRAFLDWKSYRDISPDREAIREELEDMLFGDTEMVVENGDVKFVKRNTQLRSIKDLLNNMNVTKGSDTHKYEHKEEREREQEHNIQPTDPATKVTNVTEMKALEMAIANILDDVWQVNMDNYVDNLVLSVGSGSINLRQITIIGGVFQFDFFEDEPQPYVNKDSFKMQLHYGEYELKRVLFDQVPKVRIDLAAEAERQTNMAMRKISLRKVSRVTLSTSELPPLEDEDSLAVSDDDLVWISLKLPKEVIYFETPMPVRWSVEKMQWIKDDIYDTKWNQKTHVCNFKLGKSGPFAIAISRFSNLPYFDFSIRPSLDWKKNPEIELEITTRNFPITFKIKEETITIDELVDLRAENISHIINVPFTFDQLVVAMRSCGIDLFPDWDTFLYINTSMKKLKTLEEHMYYCIGLSAPAFEYASSFHNTGTRVDRIYVRIRECFEKAVPQPKFRTLVADPFKVVLLSTEKIGLVGEESDEVGYTPDLKYLTEIIASKRALRRMKKASKRTIGTLVSLLTATKVLSYT